MAVDVFLSIPGIPGERLNTGFKGTIVTPYYEWSLTNEASLSGQSGRTVFQPLTIQKIVDSTSPRLMQLLAQGTTIASMTLLLAKAGGGPASTAPFLVYQFQDVQVVSLQEGGASGDVPAEHVTFVFGIYQVRYRMTEPDGSLSPNVTTSSWSVLTNSVPNGPVPG